MARIHRPARMHLGAVALLLLAACTSEPALSAVQARDRIAEEVPDLLEAAVGERRSAPTDVVHIDCGNGRSPLVAERHARVAALHDDDPDAVAEAARGHLEEWGAEITSVDLLPEHPRVEAVRDGVRYVLLVDTETARITAAATTACYSRDAVDGG
jgi:hypothetical protein